MDEAHDDVSTRPADDRPRGVSKSKLGDINADPKLSIFYRPFRNAPMTPILNSVSRDAAILFCDRIRASVQDNNSRSYVVTGGKESAYRLIFSWINDCVQLQSIEKFPEIPEPEEDPFQPTIDIIAAGERLGVPAGSLAYHLKKRLHGCARKRLMPLDQVRNFYDASSEVHNLGLKDIACASVFNAWWDARLDESVNPELMEELYDMRQENQELDQDLHDACQTRREEVEKKWAEKKAKREAERAEQAADGAGWNGGNLQDQGHSSNEQQWDADANATTAGDWSSAANDTTHASQHDNNAADQFHVTAPAVAGWDTYNTTSEQDTTQGWDQFQKNTGHDSTDGITDPAAVDDWADEMNEVMQEAPPVTPAAQW